MEVLTTRIPADLLRAIREIEKDERSERAEVVRRLLDKAVHEWNIGKALKMVSDGRWTIRHAAKFAGLTYHEIIEKMTDHRIDSGPLLRELKEAPDSS